MWYWVAILHNLQPSLKIWIKNIFNILIFFIKELENSNHTKCLTVLYRMKTAWICLLTGKFPCNVMILQVNRHDRLLVFEVNYLFTAGKWRMSRQDLTLEFVNKIGRFVCTRKCNCQISTEVNQTNLMSLLFFNYYYYYSFIFYFFMYSLVCMNKI